MGLGDKIGAFQILQKDLCFWRKNDRNLDRFESHPKNMCHQDFSITCFFGDRKHENLGRFESHPKNTKILADLDRIQKTRKSWPI